MIGARLLQRYDISKLALSMAPWSIGASRVEVGYLFRFTGATRILTGRKRSVAA